jgi:superfamily I DNA/RNA helicase
VAKLAGKRAREISVGTFHAFCVRVLREHETIRTHYQKRSGPGGIQDREALRRLPLVLGLLGQAKGDRALILETGSQIGP